MGTKESMQSTSSGEKINTGNGGNEERELKWVMKWWHGRRSDSELKTSALKTLGCLLLNPPQFLMQKLWALGISSRVRF